MFSTKIRIYFFDADPAGISFYGNLFKYAHTAYEEFMWTLYPGKNVFMDRTFVLPIYKTNAKFIKPINIGDEIRIDLTVTKVKEFSFEVSYNFYNAKNELTAEAQTVHVSVLKKTFKKIQLTLELKDKLILYLIQKD